MSIIFAGAPNEKSSSYTEANKLVCESWGELISSLGGSVKAKYTAWSYILVGEIKSNGSWNIRVEKSTHSAMKSFLKARNSTVIETLKLKASHLTTFQTKIVVRKKNLILDLFRKRDNFIQLKNNYILFGNPKKSNRINEIVKSLSSTMLDKSLNRLEIKNQKLILSIYSNNNSYPSVSGIIKALS